MRATIVAFKPVGLLLQERWPRRERFSIAWGRSSRLNVARQIGGSGFTLFRVYRWWSAFVSEIDAALRRRLGRPV